MKYTNWNRFEMYSL